MDTQTLIDKQLIRELQNHYSYSIDSGEYDNLDNVNRSGFTGGFNS
ncbi:MAG: hypothetical protein VB948_08885 [Pseudomonadales bacterium]